MVHQASSLGSIDLEWSNLVQSLQKIRKKYRTVKAVGPERTDERTYGRTNGSEFIGSFRSLKTSGEPKKKEHIAIFAPEST